MSSTPSSQHPRKGLQRPDGPVLARSPSQPKGPHPPPHSGLCAWQGHGQLSLAATGPHTQPATAMSLGLSGQWRFRGAGGQARSQASCVGASRSWGVQGGPAAAPPAALAPGGPPAAEAEAATGLPVCLAAISQRHLAGGLGRATPRVREKAEPGGRPGTVRGANAHSCPGLSTPLPTYLAGSTPRPRPEALRGPNPRQPDAPRAPRRRGVLPRLRSGTGASGSAIRATSPRPVLLRGTQCGSDHAAASPETRPPILGPSS